MDDIYESRQFHCWDAAEGEVAYPVRTFNATYAAEIFVQLRIKAGVYADLEKTDSVLIRVLDRVTGAVESFRCALNCAYPAARLVDE